MDKHTRRRTRCQHGNHCQLPLGTGWVISNFGTTYADCVVNNNRSIHLWMTTTSIVKGKGQKENLRCVKSFGAKCCCSPLAGSSLLLSAHREPPRGYGRIVRE